MGLKTSSKESKTLSRQDPLSCVRAIAEAKHPRTSKTHTNDKIHLQVTSAPCESTIIPSSSFDLIQPPEAAGLASYCCGDTSSACPFARDKLLAFFSVPNAFADKDRRHPFRAQWAKSLVLMDKKMKARGVATPSVVLKFGIGLEGLPASAVSAAQAEAQTHQDMLLLDVPDKDEGEPVHRSSTTLKVMQSMTYAANRYAFDYFVRVGDDAYFRVDYFAELALDAAFPKTAAYVGYKFSDVRIDNSASTHNFIVGMGFILTHDLTRYVCKARDVLLDGFPEDGVVGSWFVGTKVQVVHEPRFHDIDQFRPKSYAPCTNTSLLMHHMWSVDVWNKVDQDGLLKC